MNHVGSRVCLVGTLAPQRIDLGGRGLAELEAAERQKVRGEISTMVNERPDEVAAMLRGWLTESKS